MRLVEMEKLPDRAGFLPIIFLESSVLQAPLLLPRVEAMDPRNSAMYGIRLPESMCVLLPLHERAEYFSLREGVQFLYRSWSQVWFGGTDVDHAQFFTQLQPTAIDPFLTEGEEAFYEGLKPLIIQWAEAQWGKENTVRQGDIFAHKLPFSWSAMMKQKLWEKRTLRGPFRRWGRADLLGTRHELKGFWATFQKERDVVLVGGGTLTAPDHPPLQIFGPHIIAQTAMLVAPRLRALGD